jgi:hypothetical protein
MTLGAGRRAAIALGSLLAVAGASAPAQGAQTGSRVVIVRERGAADPVIDRAEVRLAAELRAAGFDVQERVVDGDADARLLVEEPGDAGPFATVLLRRAGARAATDVWVADHVTHKTVVRRFGAQGGEGSDRALALRVVELMRASLVEPLVLPAAEPEPPAGAGPATAGAPGAAASAPGASAGPPGAPPSSPAMPPQDVVRWTREGLHDVAGASAPRFGFSFGVAGAYAGPNIGPALAPELRLVWHITGAWSLGLLGATAFGGGITESPGTAQTRQDLGLAEIGFESTGDSPVHALVTLGAGAYHVYASGEATAPYFGQHGDTISALFSAGVGVRLRLTAAAAVVLDVRELLAAPRPVIVFGTTQVAEAMSPGTLAGVSLAVDL